jgi:hypothetical protein
MGPACHHERLGDHRIDHCPDRFGVTVGRRPLRLMDQRAVVVDETDGDLRTADVDGEGG